MQSVRMTPELRRVVDLPRRTLPEATDLLVRRWTAALRTPHGRQTLLPLQALALDEIFRYGLPGLYLSAPVGAGKTLFAYLLMTCFDARRGAILAPGGMISEMRAMHREYRDHWLAPPKAPTFISFEALDKADPADNPLILNPPDVLDIDESHRLRRPSRVAHKHVARFMRAVDRGDVPRPEVVACMTGTPGRMSVMDQAPHLVWCLGEHAPVPRPYPQMRTLADAIDHKPRAYAGVGVLRTLGGEGKTLKARAQDWFRQRLADTPGVIMSSQDSCDTELRITQVVPPVDALIEKDFGVLRKRFETPGGVPISDSLHAWRLENELSLGYYGVWKPPPPKPWLLARKAVATFVRKKVQDTQHAKRPLDTESRVFKAFPEHPAVAHWLAIKDTYRIAPKPVWRSPSVVRFVANWLTANGPALAYVWSVPFAEALQRATGLRWYGRKGLDAAGTYISRAPGNASAIVSGQANIEGRNLQQWHRAIYVMQPQAANLLEQAFGRMHRQKQTQDVEIYMLVACAAAARGFEEAVAEDKWGTNTFGTNYKIRRAVITRAKQPQGTYRYGNQKEGN